MERAEKVRNRIEEMIDRGEKPSVSRLSRDLDFPESDIHRCLNMLESEGSVETYARDLLGRKHRFVGLRR